MLVSRISPAPSAVTRRAHSTASRPVFLRPPWVYTSQPAAPPARCLASIATTMHCEPYLAAASRMTSGDATAAELKLTLSAPALRSRRTSATVRTPPPTVSGMNTCDATASMIVQDQVAVVAGRGDVEEGQLVGALLVVAGGDLDRIAGVAQLDEVDALDDATGGDVEAGDDSFGEHVAAGRRAAARRERSYQALASSSARACAAAKSSSPL